MRRIVLISALLVSAFSLVGATYRWHGYGDNSGDMCGSCDNIDV